MGTNETSGQLLAIAFSDFLMPNRESNSSLVSLLNAEEHVSRKEAIKLSFLAIRKYLDFLDCGTKDCRSRVPLQQKHIITSRKQVDSERFSGGFKFFCL